MGRWDTDQRVIDVRYAEEDEMFVAFCDDFQPFILASKPTKAEALLAARCTVLNILVGKVGRFWGHSVEAEHYGRHETAESALCAAIDARKTC